MLVKCIECNHEVSEYADMCPQCGCPIDKIKEGLQTDMVVVETFEETVVTTSFDVSKTVCPVCKTKCESGAKICPICGFNELHKEFISKEDGNLWLETVVIPYRTEWEKQKSDLKTHIEDKKTDNYPSDFEIEGTVLKKYKGRNTIVIIPSGVQSIIGGAFYGHSLLSITLPDGVKNIGKGAFTNCKMHEIHLPNSVESIGEIAFALCSSLREITIPKSVHNMGNSVFGGCLNLRKAFIPKDLIIPLDAFEHCHPDLEIIRY